MKKEEYIERRGEAAYQKMQEQSRAWKEAHPEEVREQHRAWKEAHPEEKRERDKKWKEAHPEKVIANHREQSRKGGKHYAKRVIYERTGLQGARHIIRATHRRQYRPYKKIIAPDSQVHHEWIPETSEYRGVALVEADQHMHGFIDVIKIFEGKITLYSEEEIRNHLREGS